MIPRRFAFALEFSDIRGQLVEIDLRGSRNGADLRQKKTKFMEMIFTHTNVSSLYTRQLTKKSETPRRVINERTFILKRKERNKNSGVYNVE